ncbi:hypothetical protein Droror1_Dr00000772 [Drosera rotundifolia]
MEKSERSLAPEWLKNAGNGSGGGTSNHHNPSSRSDGHLSYPKRNRSSKSSASGDSHRPYLDRSLSSNSRTSSSSNGSIKHDKNYSRSYSNFNRNNRDRDRDRSAVTDHWDTDFSDPLRSILPGRNENDLLRRSQSMLARATDDLSALRISFNSRSNSLSNSDYSNAPSVVSQADVQKVPFERDFPSLQSEERPVTPELSRVSSPVLSRGVQSMPVVNSVLTSGDARTLADVPTEVGGNSTGFSPGLQPAGPTSFGATTTSGGLNMAEALVRPSARLHSSENQKLEELAIIQSKRLIPMTPTVPKSSVPNPSDRLKPKTAARAIEPAVTPRNGYIRSDAPKPSLTPKLQVLKPVLENGAHPASKDVTSPTAAMNTRNANLHPAAPPSIAPAISKNPANPKLERKAQAQSRTDFFNSVRKKSMISTSVTAESNPVLSTPTLERTDEENKDVASNPTSPSNKNCDVSNCNGEASITNWSFNLGSEEEQYNLMRTMGWQPASVSSDDDEGLTEDEIREFCQKYMELKPALKRFLVKLEETCQDEASSEPSPADGTN